MPKYNTYSYIYPPRPKNAVPPNNIVKWDNGTMLSQPKINGCNWSIYMNEDHSYIMNRHGQRLTNFQLSKDELSKLYRGKGWMIINGEYLNKSKRDETGDFFNHKLIIFDILVFNGDYLVGKTFQERIDLLDSLYGCNDSDKYYLYSISENVYRVKSYYDNFDDIFNKFIKIDVIEGLVCKRKNARLELGVSENNNVKSQIKFRKKCNSYNF